MVPVKDCGESLLSSKMILTCKTVMLTLKGNAGLSHSISEIPSHGLRVVGSHSEGRRVVFTGCPHLPFLLFQTEINRPCNFSKYWTIRNIFSFYSFSD